MTLGGAVGVACWEVIGDHTKNPYHFLSSDVIWNIILVLIQSLMTGIAANVLENLITVWSVKQAVGTPLYFMTLNPLF